VSDEDFGIFRDFDLFGYPSQGGPRASPGSICEKSGEISEIGPIVGKFQKCLTVIDLISPAFYWYQPSNALDFLLILQHGGTGLSLPDIIRPTRRRSD
jgi:hypothetical protein